jgi:hypothetical protein
VAWGGAAGGKMFTRDPLQKTTDLPAPAKAGFLAVAEVKK